MMDSLEDVLSDARVLESEMVSGSDVLKYVVRLARKVWVFAACRFWLKRPKYCHPFTKCLLLNNDSADVEKLGRGIGCVGLFRDDFLESDRPGWKKQVSLFFKIMPCFGAIMTSGNSSVGLVLYPWKGQNEVCCGRFQFRIMRQKI